MPSSSEEWWDVGGESLHKYAWSITSLGGRLGLPTLRGGSTTVPFRPGTPFYVKTADQRTLTLTMFVLGIDPDTDADMASAASRARFNDNFHAIQRLFWTGSGGPQVPLTKRWLTGPEPGTLLQATAMVEPASQMPPTMTGRLRAEFSLDLLLSDPYFYAPQLSQAIVLGEDPVIVTNEGDVPAQYGAVEVDLIGPLTNPRLTNLTPTPNVWIQFVGRSGSLSVPGIIPAGHTVKLNCDGPLAFDGENQVTPNLMHAGTRSFFALATGENEIQLTADDGDGSAVVRWNAPYL
jgi:hypothetical protein